MTSLRYKGLFAAFTFVASMGPAWSKSLYPGILADFSHLSLAPRYVKDLVCYLPLTMLVDVIFSVAIFYYLKKAVRHGTSQ